MNIMFFLGKFLGNDNIITNIGDKICSQIEEFLMKLWPQLIQTDPAHFGNGKCLTSMRRYLSPSIVWGYLQVIEIVFDLDILCI